MKRRRVASNAKREFWIAMREMQRRLEETREQAERDRQQAERDRQRVQAEQEQERQRVQAEQERDRQRVQAEQEQERQRVQTQQERERKRAQAEWEREQAEWKRERTEWDRQWEKRRAEADARLRRAEAVFIGNWGKLVESLVEGDLARLLRERGVEVAVVASRVELVLDPRRREIDLLAVNAEEVVAVEVKTTMKVADVRRFVELLEEVRELLPIALRRMRIYGGMAYLRAEEEAARYAERRGLYVIRATGNSASIVNATGFRPRAFDPETPATDA